MTLGNDGARHVPVVAVFVLESVTMPCARHPTTRLHGNRQVVGLFERTKRGVAEV